MHWRAVLPWHEPERQAVTTGFWGWFPNIPRNWFGRIVWLLLVGGMTVTFSVLAVTIMVGMVLQPQDGAPLWGDILLFALLLFGCLLFAWHFLNGIALARVEDARLQELREELAQANQRVERARRRMIG